ncbi:MAG: ABC transporter ATP-binding protein/permease [Lachnospiraceae bacterium]|nr:ABC transporter ATP-binding protein/permease [Lachnospiraceae bacterium]
MQKKITKLVIKASPLLLLEIITSIVVSLCVTKGNSIISTLVDEMLQGTLLDFTDTIPVFVILVIVGFIASFAQSFFAGTFANVVSTKYRRLVAEKLYRIEYRYITANNTGTILNKIIGDIGTVNEFLNSILPDMIGSLIATIVYAVYVARMKFTLFVLMLICYPLILGIANYFVKRIQKLTQTYRQKTDAMADIAQSAVSGILIVRAFGLEKRFREKMDGAAKDLVENEQKRVSITNTILVIRQMLTWLPSIICALYAALLVSRGDFSVGNLLGFVLILGRFVESFIGLPFAFVDATSGMVSIDRIEKVLAGKDEPTGKYMGEDVRGADKIIELKNMNFAYDDTPVLKDVNLTISSGDNIAFVGESGGGKSTIVHLLCGLYDDFGGDITIYGKSIREWDKQALRDRFSLVSQDVFLFPMSIEENVAFGSMDATHEAVVKACKEADIHDFIESLPEGYYTVIGERGTRLSGGQKQRLSIARAILKNAPILIMDEPTSSVDVAAENEIQRALEQIGQNKTCITIAHRLNTIKNCNHIYRLEDGRLTEGQVDVS